jgi:single stranded DNA-binding protein
MNREHISTADLVGRLGQEPELRYTENNVPYVHLSVATSERWTAGNCDIREKTEWHRAVAWGETAEQIARDFKKGDSIALAGALRINSYEKEGVKNRTTELHVERADKNPDPALSKNEARLVGVVREDAKARTLDSGTSMTLVSVATRTMVNGKEREDWHSITMWNKTAEAARDIKAGDTIAINGSLRHRTVGDDGQERKLSAVDCRQFQILERARERTQEPSRSTDKDLEAPGSADSEGKARSRSRSRGKNVERGM